jgi:hypothetical protein
MPSVLWLARSVNLFRLILSLVVIVGVIGLAVILASVGRRWTPYDLAGVLARLRHEDRPEEGVARGKQSLER